MLNIYTLEICPKFALTRILNEAFSKRIYPTRTRVISLLEDILRDGRFWEGWHWDKNKDILASCGSKWRYVSSSGSKKKPLPPTSHRKPKAEVGTNLWTAITDCKPCKARVNTLMQSTKVIHGTGRHWIYWLPRPFITG